MLYENLIEFVTNETSVTLSDRMMKDRPRPGGLRDAYDRIAADWAKDYEGDTWWRECTAKFASLLPWMQIIAQKP